MLSPLLAFFSWICIMEDLSGICGVVKGKAGAGRTVLRSWQCSRQLLERLSISHPLISSGNCLRYLKAVLQHLFFSHMTQSLHPLDLHWSPVIPRSLVLWTERGRGSVLWEPSHIHSSCLRDGPWATSWLSRALEQPWSHLSRDCSVPPFIPCVCIRSVKSFFSCFKWHTKPYLIDIVKGHNYWEK